MSRLIWALIWVPLATCRMDNPAYHPRRASPPPDSSIDLVDIVDTVDTVDTLVQTGDAAPADSEIPADSANTCTPTALVGYWRLDEAGGLVAIDSACGGTDGILIGYTAFAAQAGRVGGALGLDGATQWIKVPDVNDRLDTVATTNAITVAAWVKRDVYGISWSSIISRQYLDKATDHFSLAFREYTNHQPSWTVNNYQAPEGGCTSSESSPLGRWMHVAGTYDGATGRLYVDGVEACSFVFASAMMASANPVLIGAENNGAGDMPNEGMAGAIDDVVLYDRALTSSEVAALAAGGAPPSR